MYVQSTWYQYLTAINEQYCSNTVVDLRLEQQAR